MKCLVVLSIFVGITIDAISSSAVFDDYAKSDEFIQSLLSESFGKSDAKFKTLFRIQNGAFDLLSLSRKPLTTSQKDQFLRMLDIASKANNQEKVIEILGKLLLTIQSTVNSTEIAEIISKYGPRLINETSSRKRRSLDGFDPIFDSIYALDGGVTLIFTFDTTGSMGPEKAKSVQIIQDIIDMDRPEVDYMLSEFNDPTYGPVTFRDYSQKDDFKNDVSSMIITGGGDCAELAFTGMLEAMNYGVSTYDNPMFVFTDAAPKDPHLMADVLEAAEWSNTKINFFLSDNICGQTVDINKFSETASITEGHVFSIQQTTATGRKRRSTAKAAASAFVAASLKGKSTIKYGSLSSGVSYTATFHNINIDSEISYASIIVSYEKTSVGIKLMDPSMNLNYVPLTSKDAIIYELDLPQPGTWRLEVPSDVGEYDYKVSVAFKEPIAISVRYLIEERGDKLMLIQRPLSDVKQHMLISVVGGDKINLASLKAEMIDKDGNSIKTLNITSSASGDDLKLRAEFTPTNTSFNAKLTGLTLKGFSFERITEQVTIPLLMVFKTLSAGTDFSALLGSTGNRIAIMMLIKPGSTGSAELNVTTKYSGTVTPASKSMVIRTRAFLFLKYNAPSNLTLRGKTDNVIVKATYGGQIINHRISMLMM